MLEGRAGIVADVVIVGGGPAGVLLAHYFPGHGIPHKVLERGKIAQSWRDMRPGMALLSPGFPAPTGPPDPGASDLVLPRRAAAFPTREDFLCYVDAFARGQASRSRSAPRSSARGGRRRDLR